MSDAEEGAWDIGGLCAEPTFDATDSSWSVGPTIPTILTTGTIGSGLQSFREISDDEALAFFKQMRPSLRERLIEDTEYGEMIEKMSGDSVSPYSIRVTRLPTRFSSEQLKRAHMDALMDEELKKE